MKKIAFLALVISTLLYGCQDKSYEDKIYDEGVSLELAQLRKQNIKGLRYKLSFNIPEDRNTRGLNRTFTIGENLVEVELDNAPVKKGGVMASNHVGGLSGAFIPVSEDEGMIAAAESGVLTLDKLEAMTCVCSVGLDMIAVPGDTPASTISAIIADEAAIGMVNSKTTAVRIIPAPNKVVGDRVEMGGLLGSAPVMPVHDKSSELFIARGGRIPAPLQSLKN